MNDIGKNILSYAHEKTNRKVFAMASAGDFRGGKLLDAGAGEGYLTSLLAGHIQEKYRVAPAEMLSACDLHPENFKPREPRCDRVGSDGRLPYPAASFDLVACVEVFEHIEDQFALAREFFRVLKPGGRVLLTTPNVLNINSRLRFLHSGFGQLFNPLPLTNHDAIHLGGHIHPISFYFLSYLFRRAGFGEIRAHFDFQKRSGFALSILFYLPIRLWHAGFRLRMRRKLGAIYLENRALLDEINRWRMLTSRTLILEAVR
jgi:SAM-dependent methyltransferase